MPDGSNTTPKLPGGATGKGFVKGDPRINRKGRPRSFDALRSLAQQVAHEPAMAGGRQVVIDGHVVTITEALLRSWAMSKDARLQQAFMEYAYGKAPTTEYLKATQNATTTHKFDLSGLPVEVLRALVYGGDEGKAEEGSGEDSSGP